MNCVRCKQTKELSELNKHSVYKCKSCNAERIALRDWKKKHGKTIHKTAENYPHGLSTENKPVSEPIVDSFVDTKQAIIAERRKLIENVMAKGTPVDTQPTQTEQDDVQIVSLRDEVADYYV